MSLVYTGASGIFTHVGKLIARLNGYNSLAATTLPADLTTLLTAFGTTWLPEEGIAAAYEGLKDQVTGWRQSLAGYADQRLLDYSTVLTPLGLDSGAGLDTVLPQLLRQMLIDAQTVKACTCTATAPAAVGTPAGNGQAFVTTVLDGYNAPVLGAQPSVWYNGWASQFCVPSETMVLECVADSMQDGLPEGSEQFGWVGGPPYGDLDYRAEGSGEGPGLQVANGYSLLTNGDLETWSANVPAGWSLDSGTAGTHLLQETTAANVFRGSSSARLVGDGLTTVQLSQAVPSSLLNSKRRYHACLAVKASSTQPAGYLRVQFAGTGYGPAGGEFAQVQGPQFPTGWTLYSFFLNAPAVIPSDFKLTIQAVGLGAGVSLWADSVSLAPVVYHGGVGVAIAAGSSRWLKGDRLTFQVSNDGAGLFQSFFRRHYQTQLPSVASGSSLGFFLTLPMTLMTEVPAESIADTLVQ